VPVALEKSLSWRESMIEVSGVKIPAIGVCQIINELRRRETSRVQCFARKIELDASLNTRGSHEAIQPPRSLYLLPFHTQGAIYVQLYTRRSALHLHLYELLESNRTHPRPCVRLSDKLSVVLSNAKDEAWSQHK
jgi:hypothetical protein